MKKAKYYALVLPLLALLFFMGFAEQEAQADPPVSKKGTLKLSDSGKKVCDCSEEPETPTCTCVWIGEGETLD